MIDDVVGSLDAVCAADIGWDRRWWVSDDLRNVRYRQVSYGILDIGKSLGNAVGRSTVMSSSIHSSTRKGCRNSLLEADDLTNGRVVLLNKRSNTAADV